MAPINTRAVLDRVSRRLQQGSSGPTCPSSPRRILRRIWSDTERLANAYIRLSLRPRLSTPYSNSPRPPVISRSYSPFPRLSRENRELRRRVKRHVRSLLRAGSRSPYTRPADQSPPDPVTPPNQVELPADPQLNGERPPPGWWSQWDETPSAETIQERWERITRTFQPRYSWQEQHRSDDVDIIPEIMPALGTLPLFDLPPANRGPSRPPPPRTPPGTRPPQNLQSPWVPQWNPATLRQRWEAIVAERAMQRDRNSPDMDVLPELMAATMLRTPSPLQLRTPSPLQLPRPGARNTRSTSAERARSPRTPPPPYRTPSGFDAPPAYSETPSYTVPMQQLYELNLIHYATVIADPGQHRSVMEQLLHRLRKDQEAHTDAMMGRWKVMTGEQWQFALELRRRLGDVSAEIWKVLREWEDVEREPMGPGARLALSGLGVVPGFGENEALA